MPIEFRCPNCSKLLRTPDESAGKKAKCPQCGSIADVPTALSSSGSPAGPLEGSPSPFAGVPSEAATSPWQPPSLGAPPPKPSAFGESASPNPYASPQAAGSVGESGWVEEPARTGLPWEVKSKSLGTYWETGKLILGSPTAAFAVMQREGGLGTPIQFLLIGGVIGALFNGVYNTLLQVGLLSFVGGAGGQNGPPGLQAAGWIQVVIQLPIALVAGTIGALIGSFVTSGIYHLCLMLLGGARFGYETTYRVVAYVNGAAAIILAIPLCGQYVVGLLALIYSIIGLSAAQRISGGKAAAAVLLPVVACALACGVAIAAVVAVGFAAARGG